MEYVMELVAPDGAYEYFLRTLANKTRLKILNELLRGEKNVTQLTQAIKVDQSTISNNLSRLKSCGFVQVTPNGKERIYTLNKETIQPLMALIKKHVDTHCVECIKK